MKLYTEEQVTKLTTAAFVAGLNHNTFIFGEAYEKITPIELPSDELILITARDENIYNNLQFRKGAKWLKEQITKTK